MWRAASVGCGSVALRQMALRRKSGSVTIEAVCDKNPTRASALANRFGVGRAVTSFEEVWANCELNLVDLAPGPETYLPRATHAVEAGLHVMSQKPFVGASEAADRIVTLAQQLPVQEVLAKRLR